MKKILIIIIALSFLIIQSVLVFAPTNVQAEQIQYGSISGTVYGKSGWVSYPLFGARVEAGGTVAFTDLFGYYHIDNLPLNGYTVSASKNGYATQNSGVVLTPSNPVATVSFILERTGDGGGKTYLMQQAACESGEATSGD